MLFDIISDNWKLLCFFDGIIANIDNDNTCKGENNEFLTILLDMSLNELSRMLCN